MKNKHLTAAERGIIEGMLQADFKLEQIASKLGRDETTISREIENRSTPNGYVAWSAQLDYETKRKRCKQKKKMDNSKRQKYVIKKLETGWSPEQIAGRLKRKKSDLYVCPETIYVWLYEDAWAYDQEKLYQYLRLGRKKRKPKNGRSRHKGKIPNRVGIDQRPDVTNEFGHFEGDSVIYPHKMAINTINELTTGLVAFTLLERKTAKLTARAMTKQLKKYQAKTLTLDNGSEFTNHQRVSEETGVSVYFADPYASWQRGANENVNMLLRGYLPKRHNIQNLTQAQLDDIATELNNRPRKRLGFQTPLEVYSQLLINKNFAAVGSRM